LEKTDEPSHLRHRENFIAATERATSADVAVKDDYEVNLPATPNAPRKVTSYDEHVHDHQHHQRRPLEAIELIPYKHQVGGHTTLWRFSRRAVCKQLNNRENEFYEIIESHHRDLLPFLPRYVLAINWPFFFSPDFRARPRGFLRSAKVAPSVGNSHAYLLIIGILVCSMSPSRNSHVGRAR
jgi:hypothetical protein